MVFVLIRTLAMSVSTVSCERSREYSSAMASDASSVKVGFIHLAMWMYFFMNDTLIILSLCNTKTQLTNPLDPTSVETEMANIGIITVHYCIQSDGGVREIQIRGLAHHGH
jgi:hypothetical protein